MAFAKVTLRENALLFTISSVKEIKWFKMMSSLESFYKFKI